MSQTFVVPVVDDQPPYGGVSPPLVVKDGKPRHVSRCRSLDKLARRSHLADDPVAGARAVLRLVPADGAAPLLKDSDQATGVTAKLNRDRTTVSLRPRDHTIACEFSGLNSRVLASTE